MNVYQMQNAAQRQQMAAYQAARRQYAQNPSPANRQTMQQAAQAVMANWQRRWWH